MYPRMHKICGVSIEEFLRKMYDFGTIQMQIYDQFYKAWSNLYEFIECGDPTVDEDDLINCIRIENAVHCKRDDIKDIIDCLTTYSHTDEFKALSKSLDLYSLIDFEKQLEDEDTDVFKSQHMYVRTAMNLGILDDYIDQLMKEYHKPEDEPGNFVYMAYHRFKRLKVGLPHGSFHIDFMQIFNVEPQKFIEGCCQEFFNIRDFVKLVDHQFNSNVKLLAVGQCVPKDINSLIEYYILMRKRCLVIGVMDTLSDHMMTFTNRYTSKLNVINTLCSIQSEMSEIHDHSYKSFSYFLEILLKDKLNIGYIDEIRLSDSIHGLKDPDMKSVFAINRLHADVRKFMESKIDPWAYDEFYREYFYGDKQTISDKLKEVDRKYQFMNQLFGFDHIPADRFKSIFTIADQYIDNIDTLEG